MLSRAKAAGATLAYGLLFVLLLACTSGVSGKWLVKSQDAAIAQERATAVLRSEGFTQWTLQNPRLMELGFLLTLHIARLPHMYA